MTRALARLLPVPGPVWGPYPQRTDVDKAPPARGLRWRSRSRRWAASRCMQRPRTTTGPGATRARWRRCSAHWACAWRRWPMAALDEADSFLLDEAEVPLILSRGAPHAARRGFLWQALVRRQHRPKGLIPPLRFIALAEELGLIEDIGRWVIQTACRDAAQWARDGPGETKIAVNVAKPQFQFGSLSTNLRADMAAAGLKPHQMVLELTESMLMDDVDNGRALMHELKALDVTLSIDDFGTGYSSLVYLRSFPLDEPTIDRSFVVDLPDSTSDVAIVRAGDRGRRRAIDSSTKTGLALDNRGLRKLTYTCLDNVEPMPLY